MRSLLRFSTRNPRDYRARMCLRCGYRGAELQSVRSGMPVFFCPSCGLDLYARPARSYAELEGLDAPRTTRQRRSPKARKPHTAVGPGTAQQLARGLIEFGFALGYLFCTVLRTGVLWRVRRASPRESRPPVRAPRDPIHHAR